VLIDVDESLRQAKELLAGHASGECRSLDRIRWNHPRFRGRSDEEIRSGAFDLADAQQVIARLHHFESWSALLEYVDALKNGNPAVLRFERAKDALISGDIDALRAMLDEFPELIHQRSTRTHRSTLLHYTSANGVEDYRQITPKNILEITKLLLDRGAEVDATSEAYGGGSTTLGLVSTSAHPRARGLQIPMIDLLLAHGAKIDGENTLESLVNGALANGCPEAAAALAARGAGVNTLYAAAAVGDLERVHRLFPSSAQRARETALIVAAQQGQSAVVSFLLDNGVDVQASNGMTALHQASAGGHTGLMDLLIQRGAGLEALNEFGGTVLGSTLWFAYHLVDEEFIKRDIPRAIELLVARGARVDFYPELQKDIVGMYERAASLSRRKHDPA
jgi:hypothetical protein